MERVLESQWCEQCGYEQVYDYQCPCGKDQLHPECPWYQDALWAALEDSVNSIDWVDRAVTAERELDRMQDMLENVARLTDQSYYGNPSISINERVAWLGTEVVLNYGKERKECQQK